jgi:branched-chain amino acid transport system substrate-binding protein
MRSRIALAVAWVACVGLLGFGVPVGRSAAEEPYKIGYLHSYSGYLANMGTVSRDGFLLAVAEINKRGGVNGRQITVVQENDESDPSKGVPAAIRLISGEKVLAIVGPARSDITEPLGPLAEKGPVVNMTCSFLLPTKGSFTFSTVPSPQEEARVGVDFLKAKGAKTLAILNAIDLYDKISAKAFEDEAEKHGIKVVGIESYNAAADKNFIPQLTKLKAANPDWVAFLGSGAPVPVILNQKAEIGFTAQVLGNLAFTVGGVPPLLKIAGKNAEGAYFTTLPVAVWETLPKESPRLKEIVQFREAFKAKYGDYPVMANWWTAQNYDIGFLLAEALKRAGSNPTGVSLKAALEGIRDFHGIVGTFSFSPTQHAGATGLVIAKFEKERVILAK